MIAIHRGTEILDVGVNQGSIRRFNLMKEDFIRLKFSLAENKPLLIGDYVDLTDYINSCDNEKFRIKDENTDQTTKLFVLDRNYYPTFNKETGAWDYDVQINAYYHQWKNKIFMFNPSKGAAESSFSLTDTIFTHAALLVNNLKYAGFTYNGTEFNVAYQEEFEGQLQAKGMKPITYSAVSNYAALDLIAQAFECEWWLDGGSTIYFGYRKGTETTTLTLNDEIADASISDSDGVHATRIYAFGGTTNVPKHYRDKLEFTADTIGNGWFYDSKRPVYPTMIKGTKNKMESYSKAMPKDDNSRLDALGAVMPAQKISGAINNLSLNIKHLWCMWIGDIDVKKNVAFYINAGFGYTIGGTSIFASDGDIISYPITLTLGDFDAKTAEENKTGVWDANAQVHKYEVKQGESYVIKLDFTGSYEAKPLWFVDNNGNVVDYSEETKFSKGSYTLLAYDMPSDGYLCVCPSGRRLRKIKGIELSYNIERIGFDIISDFHEYDVMRLRSSYEFGDTEVKEGSASVLEEVLSFGCDYDTAFTLTYQPTAESVNTTILVKGETEPRNVTINAGYEDDGYKISGYVPNKGTVFTFPDIILGKLSDKGSYFSTEEGGVQTGVVLKNLMIPIEQPKNFEYDGNDSINYAKNYVQANGVNEGSEVEAIMVYDWIYPKTELAISEEVVPHELEIDGDEETTKVTTYDITLPIAGYDSSLWVDPSQMFAIFQTGKAAGLRFELDYVSQTEDSVTFRLVPNEDYVTWIPNAETIPAKDDTLILDGIDVTFIDSSVIGKAEEELLYQALKDIVETSKEDKVVDITLSPDYAYNRGRIALGTLTSLVDVLSSEDNAYDSRILGFEECLDIPWDKPKYIIGDKNYYNRQASIETKLENIEKGSITLSGANIGGGGSNIPIIKVKDGTKPTDANVYSALRSREEFAKRKEEETFSEKVTFNKDIDVKGTAKAKNLSVSGNATIGGNQTINGTQEVGGLQTLRKGFQTAVFRNVAGQITGAQLTEDGILTVAGLQAMTFEVFELIYNLIKAQSGKVTYSPTVTIESCMYALDENEMELVTPDDFYNNNKGAIGSVWNSAVSSIHHVILTIKKTEENKGLIPLVNGDFIYGYVNQIGESGQYSRGGQSIMHVITPDTEIGEGSSMVIRAILEPIGDAAANPNYVTSNMPPTESMVLAQRGNINGTEGRTTSFFIDTEAGHVIMLSNVQTPTITMGNYAVINGLLPSDLYDKVYSKYSFLSKHDPAVYARYGIFENILQFDHQGNIIRRENNRGAWSAAIAGSSNLNERYKSEELTYDVVTYDGQLWKCVQSNVTTAPDQGEGWLLLVAKGTDGTSIKVNGAVGSVDELPKGDKVKDGDGYIVGLDLYIWSEESGEWINAGQFKGENGKTQYLHIAYANKDAQGKIIDFSTTDPTGREYIGTCSDFNIDDPAITEGNDPYTWKYNKGDKGNKGDSVTGSTIEYAINQSMTTKPNENEFSDDYPTTINEGDVLWTRTRVNFDNATIKTEWAYSASRQGKNGLDNSSVTFELQPNVTTIYIHDEDNLSTESINLTVRKATSKGVEIIDNNADLLADGFKLQYTYDGILDDRKDIILNPETILLEDGSEMLLEDDSAAELEFTVEDILNVKNYIEFYLVKTDTNEIWATCTVAVVHDGESLTSLIVTPKTIFVNVVAGGNKIIDPTKEHTIVFQIKKGDKPQLLSNYTIKVSAGGLVLANIKDKDSYTKSFVISCKNGSSIPPTHAITATKGSLTLTEEVTIHPVQQGLVGSSGKLYYSMGYWDETTAAEKYYENDDKRICYIYHVDSFYERTDNPLKTYKDEDGNTRYYTPNKEVEYFGSNGGWAVMPKYSAIIADFIMANFARFGSPNGGVFYSNLLFSAIGLDEYGNQVPYDMYSDDMFVGDDKNGYRLSGSVTPNLFLDFLTGAIKGNKFNEPFVKIPSMKAKESAGYLMDANVGHNVSIGRRANDKGYYPFALFLPPSEASFDVDGANCSIIVQAKANTSDRSDYDAWDKTDTSIGIGNKIVMLCSDGMIAKTGEQSNTTFMVNGVQTKFLFLEHGGFVKLKSCKVDEGVIWIVENQTDFEPIKVKVTIKNEAVVIDGNNPEYEFDCNAIDTFYTMSMGIAYGSKYIRGIMDKSNGTSKLLYNVTISKNEDDVNYVHDCEFFGTE